jgi:hypothetical protein
MIEYFRLKIEGTLSIRIKKTERSDTTNRHSSIINLVPAAPGQAYQDFINYIDLILTSVTILLTGKTKINSYNFLYPNLMDSRTINAEKKNELVDSNPLVLHRQKTNNGPYRSCVLWIPGRTSCR